VRGSWWHSSSAASAITAGGSARGSSWLVRWWKIVPGVGTTLVGASALTAMLSSYSSAARPVENRSSAALHIPYTVAPSSARLAGTAGWRAATEEMFKIQPAPRARMPGSTSVASWNGASTWTANMSA
jgi:hypothetical protein